jgi:hypothetical protein
MAVERQGRATEQGPPQLGRFPTGRPGYDIQQDLEAGEKLLWTGLPRRGLMLRGIDFFAIPFSLLWCGFAIVWETMTFTTGAPLLFRLWGVPFVLVGLYIVFGRFIVDAKSRARTVYAVTDRRVLIVSGLFRKNIQSLFLRGLAEMNLSEDHAGRGTITFGRTGFPQIMMIRGWPGTGTSLPPAFEGIDHAAQVLDIIRKAHNAA